METPDANAWIQEQNKEVQRWSNMVTRRLKTSAARFSKGKTGMVTRGKKTGQALHDEYNLVDSIGRKVYFSSGLAEGIGFKLERHGIFVQKGVGNAFIMAGGAVIRKYTAPEPKTARRRSYLKIDARRPRGTYVRKPVDWFNPILEATFQPLCDKIAEINADAAINAAHMMIK